MKPVAGARWLLVLGAIWGAAAAPVGAQADVFAPDDTGWQPALDTLVVSGSVNGQWRSFLVGDVATTLFADFMLAGAPTSATSGLGLTGQLGGGWIFGERADALATGWASAGLTVGWWFSHAALDREGAESWTPPPTVLALTVEGYVLPRDEGDTEGVEVGLRLAGVDVPWGLEELNPTLSLAAYHDFGRTDATRADLEADVGLWIQNAALLGGRETGAHVEGRLSWTEDPEGWDEAVLGDLGAWAWRAGLRFGVDWGVTTVLLRVGATDPHNVGVRAFGEVALRIWPDAAGI
jgi:hypothetical protein